MRLATWYTMMNYDELCFGWLSVSWSLLIWMDCKNRVLYILRSNYDFCLEVHRNYVVYIYDTCIINDYFGGFLPIKVICKKRLNSSSRTKY